MDKVVREEYANLVKQQLSMLIKAAKDNEQK